MSIQKLWYIKQGDEVQGPFPARIITERLLLNRVTLQNLVSLDKLAWLPISEFDELLPQALPEAGNIDPDADQEALKWREERIKASHRWLDERTGERRSEHDLASSADDIERSNADRRKIDAGEDAQHSRLHAPKHPPMLKHTRYGYIVAAIFLVLAVTAIMIRGGTVKPVNPVKVDIGTVSADCNKPATPKINWRACDKQGIWLQDADLSGSNLNSIRLNSAVLKNANLSYANLTGADLSYANLVDAKLVGANLQQANLTSAELQGADLSTADLQGATLDVVALSGAKLDNAVWLDGSICAPGSTGQCLPR